MRVNVIIGYVQGDHALYTDSNNKTQITKVIKTAFNFVVLMVKYLQATIFHAISQPLGVNGFA